MWEGVEVATKEGGDGGAVLHAVQPLLTASGRARCEVAKVRGCSCMFLRKYPKIFFKKYF